MPHSTAYSLQKMTKPKGLFLSTQARQSLIQYCVLLVQKKQEQRLNDCNGIDQLQLTAAASATKWHPAEPGPLL